MNIKKIVLLFFVMFFPVVLAKDDYINTADLNNEFLKDEYQKNYTESNNETSRIYKSAEWSNKSEGEAKITIKASNTFDTVEYETTAVYVFITCNVHGFNDLIAKRNIEHLLSFYDHVDIIGIDGNDIDSIRLYEDVSLDSVDSIISEFVFDTNKHFSASIYTALYQYLFGSVDSTVQVRDPSVIYVSLDLISSYDKNQASTVYLQAAGIYDYDYDCWDLLKKYQEEGRYFSMTGFDFVKSQNYMSMSESLIAEGYNYLINALPSSSAPAQPFNETFRKIINTVIGLADPKVFPGIDASDCLLDGVETYYISDSNNSKVYKGPFSGGDYSYSQELSYQEPVVVTNTFTVTDIVKEQYDIVSCTSNIDDAVITIEGNKITVLIDNYNSDDEVIIYVDIKLKDEYKEEFLNSKNEWFDTNEGAVKGELLVQGKDSIVSESSSPKLSLATYKAPDVPKVLKPLVNVVETLKNPDTGDKILFIMLLMISSIGIGVYFNKRKKRIL